VTEAELYEELKEAREAFENIRSILIHVLQGPGRAAFWQAVTAKNRLNAVLSDPDYATEDEGIAWHTGRGAYRNGRARTENPYASVRLRDAWFEGYDG
jgi:hypothetical protein